MAGRGRQPAAASFQLPPVTALLFLWVFSWGHVEASIDVANMTALQKHVAFFDRNMDGIITASEIFEGYVAIGCDIAFARATASSISAGVGPKTSPVDAPLPHLSIYIEYIHKAMHGSDTGAYDAKGRFVPEKFEEIFTKHAKIRPDALTSTEIEEMILANRDPFDPQSWAAPEKEWGLIYKLASDTHGFLHKDSVRGIYDGSVFFKLEEHRTSSRSDM
ncbi:probable peroxygenase 4 isoform X2 [Phragmites australis]|uniref:probable peroxygenase 4 isoform X2 n=1 Tax=Phragmites australis TaxID=29695 RepID=UPI002D780C0D|nr:probable peroxygenase 4 isoform X2 [Phragmites australis]